MDLRELVRDQIWLAAYPVSLAGTRFDARMTLARRSDGALIVHSPGPVDDAMRARIEAIGRVAVIVAPGNFHHFHVASCQHAFPEAEDGAVWGGNYGPVYANYQAFQGCVEIANTQDNLILGMALIDAGWWFWSYVTYTVNLD